MFNSITKPLFAAILFSLPILFTQNVQAQTVTGKVLDAQSKDPLPGAAIRQVGTTRGAVTQDDGSFEFRLSDDGEQSLLISYLGYKDQEIKVTNNQRRLEVFMYPDTFIGDDIFVQAVRVDDATPITYSNVERAEIERRNLGQDVPYLLQNLTSVTTTSDAGAGVGYTGIRVRGVDPARINVTINGIPLNDAESHGVFWVDLPDLASSIENIQVQRGVGTSTNGAGAIGASINLQTSSSEVEPFGEVNTGVGSFNTQKYNVKLGSGLMENGWQFEGRLSKIQSDGYIDRASADLDSYFLSASKHGERSLLKADIFTGKEVTYQAWYGVEESVMEIDRTFNEAGTERAGEPYGNQVDDYQQNYYQLHYSYKLQDNWTANASLFYTKGFGFYEEYKADEDLADYGISPANSGDPESSDLIRRRWLDNDYYGSIFSTKYTHSDVWNLSLGGGISRYEGAHFGEVIWARYAGNSENDERYYDNEGIKNDFNIYGKLQYKLTENLNSYLDLQIHRIEYEFLGNDIIQDELVALQQRDELLFFNPKFGVVYNMDDGRRMYASFAVGSKEPTRDEYVNSTAESRPEAEKLYNVEAGYRADYSRYFIGANLYGMFYRDQLVLTGEINDVGAYVRQNVPESYRVGLELQGGVSLSNQFSLGLNATLSQNKIVEFTQFMDAYDENFNYYQEEEVFENTDIAFSSSFIGNSVIGFTEGSLNAEFITKYVSRQYLDNTQKESRSIDPYLVSDLRLSYALDNIDLLKGITATLQVSNLFDTEYETNGYTFGWIESGQPIYYNYYYPQAGRNFLFQVKWSF
ncbi:MAG: TonB-dependent receptor [Balneolaceae bacterium]